MEWLAVRSMTERDKKVIEFIRDFGAADAKQIYRLFFKDVTYQRAQSRLTAIFNEKETGIHRREDKLYTGCYLYFEKDSQLRHKQLLVEFYINLLEGPGKIREFENHYSIGDIRPDAYTAYQMDDKVFLFFVEVQISANPLDVKKYETLFDGDEWQKELPAFPRIIVISDRKYKINSKLKFIQIKTDFEDWQKIFE